MITKGTVISDLELRLVGGDLGDDLDISRRQLGEWIDEARDEVVAAYLMRNRGIVESTLLYTDSNLDIAKLTDTDAFNYDRYIIDSLTRRPLFSVGNKAFRKAITNTGETVYLTSKENFNDVRNLSMVRNPGCSGRLLYYPEDESLFIDGVNDLMVGNLKVSVTYVFSELARGASESEAYYLPESLKGEVIELAEEIGRRQFNNYDVSLTEEV